MQGGAASFEDEGGLIKLVWKCHVHAGRTKAKDTAERMAKADFQLLRSRRGRRQRHFAPRGGSLRHDHAGFKVEEIQRCGRWASD
jgi:hypothetical protein